MKPVKGVARWRRVLGVALGLVLLVCLFIPYFIFAQARDVKHEPKPELSLRLQPENLVNGVPLAFRFALTNIGDKDLRLPRPNVDCSNVNWRGSLWLDESLQPSTGAMGLAKGQASCDFGSRFTGRPEPSLIQRQPEPSLIRRARGWTLLRPGESIYITTSAANLHLETTQPGLYEFSGTYVPPLLTKEQLELLTNARINVPQHQTKSESHQYLKPSLLNF